MPLSTWFYVCLFLALLSAAFAGWGVTRWAWSWSIPLLLILLMLLILALRVFGGPVSSG